MLRVRPLHATSRIEDWEKLLTALGLVLTEGDGGFRVYDAGSGRLALRDVAAGTAGDGSTTLAVEVGDVTEFARRTNIAAAEDETTPAEIVTAGGGEACRITAPDGYSFLAGRAADGTQGAEADPAIAVAGVWLTEDPGSASRTLLHVGARPRQVQGTDETNAFRAKNGGVFLVRRASGRSRSGLGFEYAGNLEALRDRLAAAGLEAGITEEASARTLHVPNPDAGSAAPGVPPSIWIFEQHPCGRT